MLRHTLTAFALVATTGLSASLSAQCLGDDGLNGPCWAPTPSNLPQFPSMSLPGTGICWENCAPEPQVCTKVELSAPNQISCGRYTADLQVFDCVNGDQELGGRLVLDYTRTWIEAAPQGQLQVYRFLAKVNMRQAPTGDDECIVPNCLDGFNEVFYYGYVDYAFLCGGGPVQSAMMLFHNCDEFIHQQGVSSTPGNFHPNQNFALVAPSDTVNPFVAGNSMPPVGALVAEAVRNVPQVGGAPCINEDPLAAGALNLIGAGCGCPFMLNPQQLTARRFTGQGTCAGAGVAPTSFNTVNTRPGLPWIHLMSTSIGSWTTNASYPGQERILGR